MRRIPMRTQPVPAPTFSSFSPEANLVESRNADQAYAPPDAVHHSRKTPRAVTVRLCHFGDGFTSGRAVF